MTKLAADRLTVPTDKGANADVKATSLMADMAAGADSIHDMALLRHGWMGRIFTRVYAPSTLGQFLRASTFGHVRQLDAVASRFLLKLAGQARCSVPRTDTDPRTVLTAVRSGRPVRVPGHR